MDLKNLENNWVKEFPKPIIIAGPNNAESESQIKKKKKRKQCRSSNFPGRNLETKNQT